VSRDMARSDALSLMNTPGRQQVGSHHPVLLFPSHDRAGFASADVAACSDHDQALTIPETPLKTAEGGPCPGAPQASL